MPDDVVQVKANIPRELKRRAFSALALRERTFTHWLCEQLEEFVGSAEDVREGRASLEGTQPSS